MQRAIGKALFPGLTYAHISGGDPEHIPDLTWEQLRDFHAVALPPEQRVLLHLRRPAARTDAGGHRAQRRCRDFERIDVDTSIPDVKRFTKPIAGRPSRIPRPRARTTRRKSQALVAWVTVPSADSFRLLVDEGARRGPARQRRLAAAQGADRLEARHRDGRRHAACRTTTGRRVFGAGLKDIASEDAEKVAAGGPRHAWAAGRRRPRPGPGRRRDPPPRVREARALQRRLPLRAEGAVQLARRLQLRRRPVQRPELRRRPRAASSASARRAAGSRTSSAPSCSTTCTGRC